MKISCPSVVSIFFSLFVVCVPPGDVAADDSLASQLPRIPAHEPGEALSTFRLQNGFQLELVACEPDVVDPIDAAFDEHGRMYVVEMRDYPFLPHERPEKYVKRQPERWGSIRLLEDRDDDGRYETSTVFADGLTWPQSVCCYKGGVFVIAPPALWYLKDTDGDRKADIKENVLEGFRVQNVQGLSNGLEWSFDHGIYWAGGTSGAAIVKGQKPLLTVNRQDLRLDPKTQAVEAVSGGQQYGHTFDDWGNRYVCNNSNHLMQVVVPARYLNRNPQLSVSNALRTIAAEGAAAPVYRISPPEPWRVVRTARRAADPVFAARASKTELVVTGFFTSATGVTVYRGGAYPPEYHGNVFIGDVGGNLVHRKRLEPNGIAMRGTRTENNVEFLASTDNWFRPTNFVNAPDGTLYVLDMYWETIEHPRSIPEDIKAHLDLESGNDRGRIYRLVSPNMTRSRPPKLAEAQGSALAELLQSPHGWVRETAHRLIWEREDSTCEPRLRELLVDGTTPQSRILALWSLQGLDKLTADDVKKILKDQNPRVREQAIRLSEEFTRPDDHMVAALAPLADDADARVRWQLAFSLGEFDDPQAVQTLLKLAMTGGNDSDQRLAILSSMPRFAVQFVSLLVQTTQLAGSSITREAVTSFAAGSTELELAKVMELLLTAKLPEADRIRLISAFGTGLQSRGRRLSQIPEWNGTTPEFRQRFHHWLETVMATAGNAGRSIGERQAALGVLSNFDTEAASAIFVSLLEPQSPPRLQDQAARTLAASRLPANREALLSRWKSLGPQARKEAIDQWTQSATGVAVLLTGLENQTIRTAELDRDKQQLLLKFPDAKLQKRAAQLLGNASENRKSVIDQYQQALSLNPDARRGQAVYAKICIQCHRAGTEGHAVGPDLASVQNKSPDDLLISILDPNRESQPSYLSYTAVTIQGRVATGLIAAESAASLTLRRAEAKEDTIARDQLDELISNGVSLMPEGLEKDLSPQQLADVIAFIKSQTSSTK